MIEQVQELLSNQKDAALEGLEINTWGTKPDFEALTYVLNTCFKADGINHFGTAEEIANYYLNLPDFSPEEDGFMAVLDGKLIGWLSLQPRNEAKGDMIYRLHENVLPEWRDRGISQALLDLGEQRAVQRASQLPNGRSGQLELGLSETQPRAIERAEARGYKPTRYFFFMVRSLDEPIPDHPLPKGFHQRPITEDDYRPIWETHHRAFEEHWGHPEITENHFRMFMDNPLTDPKLWQVAWYGEEVAGMVLNFLDVEENKAFDRKRGYTEDIAVAKPYRNQGIAKALIAKSMRMFKEMGMQETALAVDTENPSGALRLYQNLGYETERKSTAYRKPLD